MQTSAAAEAVVLPLLSERMILSPNHSHPRIKSEGGLWRIMRWSERSCHARAAPPTPKKRWSNRDIGSCTGSRIGSGLGLHRGQQPLPERGKLGLVCICLGRDEVEAGIRRQRDFER